MTIPVHQGVAALVAPYDALLVDLWGVIHDGVAPYPGVVDCLARLRDAGKPVVILSNAPRLAKHAVARLRAIGVEDGLYARLVTSGDAARQALAERTEPFYAALGRSYYRLGKRADADLIDGLDYRPVADIADAGFLLITGPTEQSTRIEDYEGLLAEAAGLGLPMICANPDLVVIRGGVREPCAGAFAARYAELGGAVRYEGKPHPLVYTLCDAALGGLDRRRVLAVGDGLATDIAGAAGAGIDAVVVTGGLLADAWGTPPDAPPDPERLAAACAEAGVVPVAAVTSFVW